MRVVAAIYSFLLGGVALCTWITHFLYEGSTREHLLPGIALYFVTLPSSLLMERVVGEVPWILSSPITILSIMTGLGGIQVGLVWLLAARCKFPST